MNRPGIHELHDIGRAINKCLPPNEEITDPTEQLATLTRVADRLDIVRDWLTVELSERTSTSTSYRGHRTEDFCNRCFGVCSC